MTMKPLKPSGNFSSSWERIELLESIDRAKRDLDQVEYGSEEYYDILKQIKLLTKEHADTFQRKHE